MKKFIIFTLAYITTLFPFLFMELFLIVMIDLDWNFMKLLEYDFSFSEFEKGIICGSIVFIIILFTGYFIFTPCKKDIPKKFKINLDNYKPKRSKYKNKL